jgi:hypothetical protein
MSWSMSRSLKVKEYLSGNMSGIQSTGPRGRAPGGHGCAG